MSEFRQDPTTKEWVILAPERARRPQQTLTKKPVEVIPESDETCPFCPGNEDQTPDESLRLPSSSGGYEWEVRAVPNMYAALAPEGDTKRHESGEFARSMDGFGVHEVIIESARHNDIIANMTYEHVENILQAYRQRYNELKENPLLKFITIFKNHGRESGTSLIHPHSQLVATPIITPSFHRRFDLAHDYNAEMGTCLYCDILNEELEKGERIVRDDGEFVILHPFASRVPYETWIVPRTHCSSFGLCPPVDYTELSHVLRDTLRSLFFMLDNPAYNMIIDSTATFDEVDPYYHWHIRIVPRQSMIAGFEIGSGIYITTAMPEETTAEMKKNISSMDLESDLLRKPDEE